MARILIVLPYSGRGFGGGLAVFNADITKAFVQEGHDVRLLTMHFHNSKLDPDKVDHGNAKFLFIENPDVVALKDPGGADGEKDRNRLYDLMNDKNFLIQGNIKQIIQGQDGWTPQIIIGHSRFSGPAAILLRDSGWFKNAQAIYFVHSLPVEGSVLSGYEAYAESLSKDVAMKKWQDEKAWMQHADLVVAVGPLIRNGVQLILQEARSDVHVHECIGGINIGTKPVEFTPGEAGYTNLLFLGRASAPIKGMEDLIMAAVALRGRKINITIRYWDDRTYGDRKVDSEQVQAFIDGVLHTKDPDCQIRVQLQPKTGDPAQEVRSHHGLLMPSYIEHFGLVPFDALGQGVPVLVNEISGAGMFLGDTDRFAGFGPPCVVKDFNPPGCQRPFKPVDYLENVAKTAFDNRPKAWAEAIDQFAREVGKRFSDARQIYEKLKGYTWLHCVQGIQAAITRKPEQGKPMVTVQREGGKIARVG